MSSQALDYTAADDVLAEITKLRAENAALQALTQSKPQGLTIRRSKPEGKSQGNALCIYGLGKYPITLYREQALRLCDAVDEIRKVAQTLPAKSSTPSTTGGF